MIRDNENEFFKFFEVKRRLFFFKALAGQEMDRFVNRERLIKLFKTSVQSGDICAITGLPGTGKSSFLLKLLAELKPFMICDYLQFSFPNDQFEQSRLEFLRTILRSVLNLIRQEPGLSSLFDANEIERERKRLEYSIILEDQLKSTKSLDGKLEAGVKKNFMKMILPIEAKAEISGSIEKEVSSTQKEDFAIHNEHTLKDSLSRIFSKLNEPIVLLIDELDKFGRFPLETPGWDNEVIKILELSRELMLHEKLIMVFSLQDQLDSKLREADQGKGDVSITGLINYFDKLDVFDLDFARAAVVKSLDVAGYPGQIDDLLEKGVLEILLEVLQGNPRLLMKYLHELSMNAYLDNMKMITLSQVKDFLFEKIDTMNNEKWDQLLTQINAGH